MMKSFCDANIEQLVSSSQGAGSTWHHCGLIALLYKSVLKECMAGGFFKEYAGVLARSSWHYIICIRSVGRGPQVPCPR